MPLVAPASTAILHRVMRLSMLMAATTGPSNSIDLVGGAVDPQPADQDRITSFGIDPGRQFPVDIDPDGGRKPKGADPFENAHLQVGGAHPGGKGTEGPVGAGMGIAHDDRISGPDEAFFRKKGMADAVAADVEKILDVWRRAQSRRILPWMAVLPSLAGVT